MVRIFAAAASYFALIFTLGVFLGTARTLWLAPRVGELAAVSCELPLMLAASWWAAGECVRHFRVEEVPSRVAMCMIAFWLLQAAELALSVMIGGLTPAQHVAAFATPAGALGLAGQAAFGVLPMEVRPRAA
jgi:hypothetical protein